MPSLDSCISDIYEPGNIPADPGQTPTIPAFERDVVAAGIGFASAVGYSVPAGEMTGIAIGVGSISGVYDSPGSVGACAGVGAMSGTPFIFQGALANNTVDSGSTNFGAGVVVTWSSETYDTNAVHDTGSNTSRLTIPSALNGKYGIIHGQVVLTDTIAGVGLHIHTLKNGSQVFVGRSMQVAKKVFSDGYIQTKTPPLLLTTGDYFEVLVTVLLDNSAVLQQEHSYIALEIVG